MVSFSMPVVCSSFSMFTKFACGIRGISGQDYTFGYCLVAKGFFFIGSLFHFANNPFYLKLYLIGAFGSILDILGAFFCNCAIATGAPAGPILALCDSQMLLVTILAAIIMSVMPHWMQILGLLTGTLGVSVLVRLIGPKK